MQYTEIVEPITIRNIAICFFGEFRVGGICYNQLKKFFSIEGINVDFFASTKDYISRDHGAYQKADLENLNLTDFKKIKILSNNDEIEYTESNDWGRPKKMFQSMIDSVMLKQQYEAETEIVYDMTVLHRFDVVNYHTDYFRNLVDRLQNKNINDFNSLNKNILFSQSIHGFEMGRGRISGLSTHKDLMLIGLGTALDLFVLSLMTEVVEKDPGLFSYKMPEYGTICPHHAVPLHYNRINLNVVEMPRVSSSGDIAFMGEGDYDSFKDLKSIIIRDDELIHGLIELFPGQDIFDIIFSTVDKSS